MFFNEPKKKQTKQGKKLLWFNFQEYYKYTI